jgi:hypothetical protein
MPGPAAEQEPEQAVELEQVPEDETGAGAVHPTVFPDRL